MAATDTPSEKLDRARRRIADADIPDKDREAMLSAAKDSEKAMTTLESYLSKLVVLARDADEPLTDSSQAAVRALIDDLATEREWSDSTLSLYESAVKWLLDMDIDVTVVPKKDSAVDQRSVLEQSEFHDIREETSLMRDRAMVDFLGFTGQRVRVVQALTIADVDVEAGVWYMPDVDGLKGADEVGNKRPLLGARKSMAEWLEMHPTGKPSDAVFTPRKQAGTSEPGEHMSAETMRSVIRTAADKAGVTDKPVNPHSFRHFFVTTAKRRYELEDSTIKHIIGHSTSSDVMSTTYRHLSDDDHIQAAESALGLSEDEEDETAPPVCDSCQRPLRPSATVCPTAGCDETFTAGSSAEDELEALAVEIEQKMERFESLKESLDR